MEEINALYGNVLDILNKYRTYTYKAINTAMVISYWQIGKTIVENEQGGNVKASYGDKILQLLSKKLSVDFGKGFSYSNLRNFRQFYLTYQDDQICYAVRSKSENTEVQDNHLNYVLRSNLSWTHHCLIMRVENAQARKYYLKEAERQNWSTRELERNINSSYFQRILTHQNEVKKSDLNNQSSEDFIKDPYVLEFLKIDESSFTNEKEIEARIITTYNNFYWS